MAIALVECAIHGVDHGSENPAVETSFEAIVPTTQHQDRLLPRNAIWTKRNIRITNELERVPSDEPVQQNTDRLILLVLGAFHAFTLKSLVQHLVTRTSV